VSSQRDYSSRPRSIAGAKSWLPGMLGRISPVVSYVALTLAVASIGMALLRWGGVREAWPIVSALSSLVVAVVAVLALGQWRAQMRAQTRRSAASDVLERAYENQELFWEISRHVLKLLMSKTFRRQLVESDAVLQRHKDAMLEYTHQVQAVSLRLHAALFKASIVFGFEFPIDPNELVPLEGATVWSWMTSALIKAAALPEGSESRDKLLEEEFARVQESLDAAPAAMKKRREELGDILRPFFRV